MRQIDMYLNRQHRVEERLNRLCPVNHLIIANPLRLADMLSTMLRASFSSFLL